MTRLWSRLVPVALAVLAVGCGDDGGRDTAPASAVTEAAERTTAAGPLTLSGTFSISVTGRGKAEGTFSGAADGPRDMSKSKFDLSGLEELSPEINGDELKGTAVTRGELNYVTSPAIARELKPPRRWVLLTDQQIVDAPGITGNQSGMGTLDPAKPVDHLRAAQGRVEKVGEERIDGVETIHYRGKVDYKRYVTLAPADDRPGLANSLKRLEKGTGKTAFPYDVWVDSDGLIRRLDGEISRFGTEVRYELRLTRIGEPADLSPPPRRLVFNGRSR